MAEQTEIERLIQSAREKEAASQETNAYLKEIANSLQGVYELISSYGAISTDIAKDIVLVKAKIEVMVDIMGGHQISSNEALRLEQLRRHELAMKLANRDTTINVEGGDAINVGDVSDSQGIAVGESSSANLQTTKENDTVPKKKNKKRRVSL